jgi:nucleoside-diphosphate-sugar epimerase
MRLGRLALVDGGELPINVVDVENLCHAIMLALAADSTDGQRIFVTDGGGISWRAFIEELSPLAERATPLPTLSRKELAVQTTTSVRRSFTRTLKHIGSSEVRAALRRDPILDGAEQTVRDLVNRLPQRIQDRMRLGLNGSPQVQKVITECVPASRYNAQQLRGVVHSCARARRALEYSSIISFTESMARFRNWYRATRGMDLDSWDLARDLLPSE